MKDNDIEILRRALGAWRNAAALRSRRLRNKRFTYGDQWSDMVVTGTGKTCTEKEYYSQVGTPPITNNLIRQMVKTIVGRYRALHIDKQAASQPPCVSVTHAANQIAELDSRALEDFLIGGVAVQRVDTSLSLWEHRAVVTNVNVNKFFVGEVGDPVMRDCEMVGQLHDLSLPQLIKRVAQGSASKARWIRSLYAGDCDDRLLDFAHALGADSHAATGFWRADHAGKCRAIEVWTRESREVTVCHNKATAQVSIVPRGTRIAPADRCSTRWDIVDTWHCRWFSPMGDLLAQWDSPWAHGEHPFVMKFYPLTDGEVHSFVEDIIDQQKAVNQIITLINNIMMASAKGVLVFPETALPDGFTWDDIRRVWRDCNGILPYNPNYGNNKPEQISVNNTNIGAYEMVKLQMQLLEEISGVHGALQGKTATGNSATLYENEATNAAIALSDIFGTFTNFRNNRDAKIAGL